MKPIHRIFLLLAIAVLIVLFFSNGLHHHLSLENIKDRQFFLQNVNAGSQIGKIDSLSGILSPGLLLSLILVGIFPLIVRRCLACFRKLQKGKMLSTYAASSPEKDSFMHTQGNLFQGIFESCTDCGACQKFCQFLSHYGTPKQMAEQFDFSSPRDQGLAYECSLCGLCTATCPEKLDLSRWFLDLRQCCVANQTLDEKAYNVILRYEQRGRSPLFSWYGLPKGCDTVFFPGCTLPGTRPAATMSLFQQLREAIPGLGIVLDCCAKPSHDLGRSTYFTGVFKEIKDYLAAHGIRQILTSCPNCTKIFQAYGQGFSVRTVYEVLQERTQFPSFSGTGMTFTVHDPCAMRYDRLTHKAVRKLLSGMGHTIVEMKHHGYHTLCCGEGGTVAAANPDFAAAWTNQCSRETNGYPIATYCAGCAGLLNRKSPAFHIADLLYDPQAVLNGNPKVAKAPFTYWHRFRIKQQLKRQIQPQVQRTRPFSVSIGPGCTELTQSQKIKNEVQHHLNTE